MHTIEELKQLLKDNDIAFHPAMGKAKLEEIAQTNGLMPMTTTVTQPERKLSLREHIQAEAMKLVRVRVTCMNPAKANLYGDFFTVASEYLGNVTKFVPYGSQTDDGYHVPQCILDKMRSATFTVTKEVKDIKGRTYVTVKDLPELAIEVLPPLTKEELAALANAQVNAQEYA